MTLIHEAPSQAALRDPEALFPEARRRRRRRVTKGAILAVVAVATAGLFYETGGRGGPPKGPPPSAVNAQPGGETSPASGPGISTGPSTPKGFPGGGSLPAGAQVTSVARFHGYRVAAGEILSSSPASPSSCSTSGCNPMVWTSTNSKRWTATWGSAPSGSIPGEQLVVAPTALLLFNDDEGTRLWRSTDATSWEPVVLPSDMAALGVRGALWGHGRYVVILNNKYTGGLNTDYGESDAIWTSKNGVAWTRVPIAGTRLTFASLKVDATGFTVRGTEDGSATQWMSPNGVAWISREPHVTP